METDDDENQRDINSKITWLKQPHCVNKIAKNILKTVICTYVNGEH